MSTEIATGTDNLNPYLAYGREITQRTIVGDLLKFSKQGEWLIGKDEKEAEPKSKWIAQMDEVVLGWVKWLDKTAVDHRMGLLREGFRPEPRAALGDLNKADWEAGPDGQARDPWQLTNYIAMREVDGDKRIVTYAPSSKSGLNCAGLLYRTFGEALPRKPGQFPIVALGKDSYKHKQYGKIMIPTLQVVGWVEKSAFGELPEASEVSQDEMDEIPF
jgi:hypothetical protein